MLNIEPFEIYSVVNGTVRLDGGAMFGVVPKVLWAKKTNVDEFNRILLATRTLIAVDRSAKRVILVDTGAGSKWAPKAADRYGVFYDPDAISNALAKLDLTMNDVTDVVATHLHFDHNGGLTEWVDRIDGPTKLRYPRAKHWVHRMQWDQANEPSPKDKASYIEQDFAALAGGGVLEVLEGDPPVGTLPGVEWVLSNGHTKGQLLPIFGAGEQKMLFIGDMVPTVNHLPLAWVMAYDLYPLTTIAEKEAIYKRCIEEKMLIAFPHDPDYAAVEIDGTPNKPIVAKSITLTVS